MRPTLLASLLFFVAGSPALASPHLSILEPAPQTLVFKQDFDIFRLDGATDIIAVAGSATGILSGSVGLGCDSADFGGFTAGQFALIERGTCLFSTKIDNAISAGAIGALIADLSNTDISIGAFVISDPVNIPAFIISTEIFDHIQLLQATGTVRVRAAVPVPATLGFLTCGLIALALRRRRRA